MPSLFRLGVAFGRKVETVSGARHDHRRMSEAA